LNTLANITNETDALFLALLVFVCKFAAVWLGSYKRVYSRDNFRAAIVTRQTPASLEGFSGSLPVQSIGGFSGTITLALWGAFCAAFYYRAREYPGLYTGLMVARPKAIFSATRRNNN
jgi:hypothetical protein